MKGCWPVGFHRLWLLKSQGMEEGHPKAELMPLEPGIVVRVYALYG
jgi:hypothetical protein